MASARDVGNPCTLDAMCLKKHLTSDVPDTDMAYGMHTRARAHTHWCTLVTLKDQELWCAGSVCTYGDSVPVSG